MKTKTPTLNAGAQRERDAVLAHVRREIKWQKSVQASDALKRLETWLLSRKKRYDARPGGLGRGKK